MIQESEVSERFHSAFDVQVPSGAALRLRASLLEHLESDRTMSTGTALHRLRGGVRVSMRFAAGALLIALALSTMAVFIATHRAATRNAPANPGPTSHATARSDWGMVSATTGWEETGWMDVYGWNHILRTTDGAAHWVDVTPPPSITRGLDPWFVAPGLNDAHYVLDTTHAWLIKTVISGPVYAQVSQLITVWTDDGGESWHKGLPVSIDTVFHPQLYFLDPSHGWLMPSTLLGCATGCGGAIYGTSDAGLHWNLLTNTPSSGCDLLNGVAFTSLRDGLSTASLVCPSGDQLFVSHDGGTTWSPKQLPLVAAGAICPCTASAPVVLDQANALIVISGTGAERELLMTSDSGATWNVRTLPGDTQSVVDFIDGRHGWTVAGPGEVLNNVSTVPGLALPLYRTDDGGLTWSLVGTSLPLDSSEGRISDIYFVDLMDGFAVRIRRTSPQSQLLKTADGGRTWSVVGSIPPS